MKSKKILSLLGGLVLAIVVIVSSAGITAILRFNKVKNYDGNMIYPSIDFVQPYYFDYFEDDDYDSYFNQLALCNYDTIIFQYSMSGTLEDGILYYPSSNANNLFNKVENKDTLSKLLLKAKDHNFKVYIGLSNADDYWSYYTNEDYLLNKATALDVAVASDIYNLYNDYEAFYGWYYSYEFFSNPLGWENKWTKMINQVIDKLNTFNDNRPLMLSPFRQVLLGKVTNEYLMWSNFFKQVNFRKGDIFAPQDSIGKITTKELTKKSISLVYKYLKSTSKAVSKVDNLDYYVNIELFKIKDKAGNLEIASFDRIKLQTNMASMFASKAVTFSFSHEALTYGGYNTDKEREEFYNKYKEYVTTKK